VAVAHRQGHILDSNTSTSTAGSAVPLPTRSRFSLPPLCFSTGGVDGGGRVVVASWWWHVAIGW
jgi:hypothetical protein